MTNAEEQATRARELLADRLHGVLSTQSLEHQGYPFGSLVPYVPGNDGLPVLLLSHLAQHTKNIDADPRCGLVVIEQRDHDIQQLARLSAVGDLMPDDDSGDAERYFRHFPASRKYHDELGFRFYRLHPLRVHWNGGFATARWFAGERIFRRNPLTPAEQTAIIAHMNHEHADALRRYLAGEPQYADGTPVEMVGIDAQGIALRSEGRLYRVPFSTTISDVDEARRMLIRMA